MDARRARHPSGCARRDGMDLRPRFGGAAVVFECRHDAATIGGIRTRRAVVLAVTVLGVAAVSAATASAHAGSVCRVPRLKGLTLTVARTRAAHAGCRLRVSGAALGDSTQTVARQSPGARVRSSNVTVWLNPAAARKNQGSQDGRAVPVAVPSQPMPEASAPGSGPATCAAEGLPVAGSRSRDPELEGPFVNPHVTPGPTELVSGLYFVHPTETSAVTIAAGYTARKDFVLQIA